MDTATQEILRTELRQRRGRLTDSLAEVGDADDLRRLLSEVDSALDRMQTHTYGKCEVCHEDVEDEFLLANPAVQYCLCALTPEKQRALEQDLALASRIQWGLLPQQNMSFNGWQAHFRYEPAGPVSGDYCDLVREKNGTGSLFFMLGDVSGKGVAASLQMARLNALFRSLIDVGLPIPELVARANRLFSETIEATQFATLVCGRGSRDGALEICNAGHCPPLVLRDHGVSDVESTGLPVGVAELPVGVRRLKLEVGETLFLYSDGLTEARNRAGEMYGTERLSNVLEKNTGLSTARLAAACLRDLAMFQDGASRSDDLTILVVRRSGVS
jgi:sigma-B regulation protein RsbU (phosphoserine phosphatase)